MAPTDAEVEQKLRAILASKEFQERVTDKYLEKLLAAAGRVFKAIGELSTLMQLAVVALCAALLALILFQLVKTYRGSAVRREQGRRSVSSQAAGPPSPEALADKAEALARDGRLREAARALQQAALVHSSQQKGLPWRPALSDGEWLALLGRTPALVSFTRRTQALAFGPAEDAQAFADAARELRLWLGGAAP